MKKIIFSLLLAVALISVSCKDSKSSNTPTDPTTDTVFTEISYLCGEYAGPLSAEEDAPHYYQFQFSDGKVTINPDGTFNGSGLVYLITLFSPEKGEDLFPSNGLYLGYDSLDANTFYCTSDPDANGVSAIYTINNGSIDFDNANRFKTGLITILGDAESSDFIFILQDSNDESLFLHYSGPAPIEMVR